MYNQVQLGIGEKHAFWSGDGIRETDLSWMDFISNQLQLGFGEKPFSGVEMGYVTQTWAG